MQSEDTYRSKLQQLAASIKAWSGFIADVAHLEFTEEAHTWRLAIEPNAARACPLEIVLHASDQSCDLTVGGETYEGWPLPSLDVVLPLVEAVADGRVVTQRTASAVTGLPAGVTTIITLADGRRLQPAVNGTDLATGLSPASQLESRTTHYVPYRKPKVQR